MNTEKTYDIIIIGGGISGLSLGFFLAEMDREVLILEKNNRAGGVIESLSYKDYHIDLGTHTAYNTYATLIELTEETTTHKHLQARAKQKYFFATQKGLKKLTSPLHWAELLWSLPKSFSTTKEGKSVKEYYSKILGKKNYENFAQHFFKAVLCQQAENYPVEFFLKRRSTKNKEYSRSFTFSNGMQTLSATVEKHPKITINKNIEIQNIDKQEDIFQLSTSKGNFEVPTIAFATYATEVTKLTKKIAPKLAEELSKISYTTVSSLGIILPKNKVAIREMAGLLTPTNDFTSIVSRDIAPNEEYRGFTIHAQGTIEEDVLLQRLCTTLGILPQDILKKGYKNNYLPKLQKGHQNVLDSLIETLENYPNIYLSGNYFQGLSLEDCISRSKSEALRYINNSQ